MYISYSCLVVFLAGKTKEILRLKYRVFYVNERDCLSISKKKFITEEICNFSIKGSDINKKLIDVISAIQIVVFQKLRIFFKLLFDLFKLL